MPLVKEEVFLKRVLCSSWHSMKRFSQPFEGIWEISLSLQSPCRTRYLSFLVRCLSLHNIRDGIPDSGSFTFSGLCPSETFIIFAPQLWQNFASSSFL